MTFCYFAYGSNLWPPQMRSRCPSATVVGTATLDGWSLEFDKPSTDGSAKLNIRPAPGSSVEGVVYEIEDGERQALDAAEPGYAPVVVDLDGLPTVTYSYRGDPHPGPPYDWYVAVAALGAASHGIKEPHAETIPDPVAPGLRPVTLDDTPLIQSILSAGLASTTDRYYAHPGEYAWWAYHDDPRFPDHFSTWLQGESGFVMIDTITPSEISVFALPSVDRWPLFRWAQRRLGGVGEVGWVDDGDEQLVRWLRDEGYRPVFSYRTYEWDLDRDLPEPAPPPGWELRRVSGEGEANVRRAAAHAAFESTMPAAMHLQRYLDFMRSPVYRPERDLVAIDPDGVVASFMIWWSDTSGIAQIEPFGTRPQFQRRGIGRALIYHGLAEMKAAGMHTCRVMTDEPRPATAFYESVGFEDSGPIRWWKPTGRRD